ncbi:sigma-54 interaction domain-containing protein [Nitrospira sp. M1]
MAGSLPETDTDPNLCSRLQALVLLADHLSEPVAIFDPTLKLVYSNSSVVSVAANCPLLGDSASQCADSDVATQERCAICPAENIVSQAPIHPQMQKGTSVVHHDDPSCPFPTSFPVTCTEGDIACVVMMGHVPEDTMVRRGKPGSPLFGDDPSLPKESKSRTTLIGQSTPMQQLLEMVRLVAQSESTVLIQGESGTGKELVAKTIHTLSPRRDHPFVVVECSSLPETLLESELFGHVKGAFTGAVGDRKGLFEEAEGGTIFLDEIADTTPTFQAKLLRVLQEGEIRPVGSNRSIKVNVRVISASNKDLMYLVKEHTFRLDLYYRLAVLPLSVPALRDRREDIPLLVNHFFVQSCENNRKAQLSIPSRTMKALVSRDWPGNVRELENVIERAVVITHDSELTIRDIVGAPSYVDESSDLPSISKAARQVVEKHEILKALQETQGDKTHAARKLHISRASLYNKLKAYDIQ